MNNFVRLACLSALMCLTATASFAGAPPAAKNSPGTIVIVFKDGHRQSFNLADIERVEFGGAGGVGVSSEVSGSATSQTARGRFFGKWQVGDGAGNDFYITLNEDGTAYRTLRAVHGHWVYVEGEAHITWDDGAMDAIRRVGSRFQKFAYAAGKTFTDDPDNVTNARNTMPHPI
jgi:hypothetical protein